MRDNADYGSLLFRLCFVGFGYGSIVFDVSVMFLYVVGYDIVLYQ